MEWFLLHGASEQKTVILDADGLKEKMAIVISSHNLAELELVCDEVAIIDNGKLLAFKTMREIKAEMESRQRVGFYVNYPNLAGKLIMDKYKIPCKVAGNCVIAPIKEIDTANVITFLTNKNIKIYKTKKINKSLEEIYFNILKSKNPSTSLF